MNDSGAGEMMGCRRSGWRAPVAAALVLVGSFTGPLMAQAADGLPAPPVMSVYKWAAALKLPVYSVDRLPVGGTKPKPAGYIVQGTKVLPCVVKRGGQPIPNARARPFVGYEVLYEETDTDRLDRQALARHQAALPSRLTALRTRVDKLAKTVQPSHDCPRGYSGPVINARWLLKIDRAPPAFREPAQDTPDSRADTSARVHSSRQGSGTVRELANIFHDSQYCSAVNQHVHGRRARMLAQWDNFVKLVGTTNPGLEPSARLAAHADVVARTATFEGDLAHGCSAHGLCEIDLITLSVKNRAEHARCANGDRQFGCRFQGDYARVAASVTQYNIWDRLFTMKDSITSCYLRRDLQPGASAGRVWRDHYGQPSDDAGARYQKEQARFTAAFERAELILSTPRRSLTRLFAADDKRDILELLHYYHPPAMGKCFPQEPRQEYMSGAYIKRGDAFFLLLGERSLIGRSRRDPVLGAAYELSLARLGADASGLERVLLTTPMPGVLVASSRVAFGTPKRCTAYGVEPNCSFDKVRRYRRTPPWLSSGRAARVTCKSVPNGPKTCATPATGGHSVTLGGRCSIDFMPMSRVP